MDDNAQNYLKFARYLSQSGCYSKSFDFYLMAFDKSSDLKTQAEPEFHVVLTRLNEVLASANKLRDIFRNLGRAIDVYPNNIHFANDTGKYLYKCGYYNEAWFHFQKALKIDASFVNAEKNLNSIKNLLIERWHFRMLNDRVRNEAYRQAIHQIVMPNDDSVLDIGTGTGLLALYANECTPVEITACDGSDIMSKIAKCVVEENGCGNIKIINKMSTSMNQINPSDKYTLVVTEMFDAALFGEHILQSLSHAWKNLIDKDGRIIPNKAEFFVIGARSDYLLQKYQLGADVKSLLDIDNLKVHVMSANEETYDCEDVHLIKDIKYMTDAQSVLKINFNSYEDIDILLNRIDPFKVELKAVENGEMNIVIGWFNLYLTDDITITTDPRNENRANAWQQAIFFDNIPQPVKKNEIVDIAFAINGGKLTMLQDYDSHIYRVASETIRFLNDNDYMKLILRCLGMACVYLGQIAEMSQMSIVDLCPFPMFGFQLMKRGAQGLVCCAKTDNDKDFFIKVFEDNDIPLSKVTILVGDDWAQDVFKDEKYHAIFCNILEECGEVDLRKKDIAQHLKLNHLQQGGLFMPANVKLFGQIVSSHWLGINNRVYNENVHNYKIEKIVNRFQVSQIFCVDLTHLRHIALTEPVYIGDCYTMVRSEMINTPIIRDGDAHAILCWYNIELMPELDEITTNRSNSFVDGTAFLVKQSIPTLCGRYANIIRCVDVDGSFKLIIDADV